MRSLSLHPVTLVLGLSLAALALGLAVGSNLLGPDAEAEVIAKDDAKAQAHAKVNITNEVLLSMTAMHDIDPSEGLELLRSANKAAATADRAAEDAHATLIALAPVRVALNSVALGLAFAAAVALATATVVAIGARRQLPDRSSHATEPAARSPNVDRPIA